MHGIGLSKFPLAQKVMTLNDLEQCNGQYLALFYRIWHLWGQLYVNIVEDRPHVLSATEMQPKESGFRQYGDILRDY